MNYRVKPEYYFYWEINASSVWEIAPAELFTNSRAGNIPYARMFCMYYMHEELELTQSSSAGRYGQKHDAVVHGIYCINNMMDVDKKLKRNFNEFIKACEINKEMIPKYLGLEIPDVDNKLKALVNALTSNNKKLITYNSLYGSDKNKSKLFSKIIVCEININLIKKVLME